MRDPDGSRKTPGFTIAPTISTTRTGWLAAATPESAPAAEAPSFEANGRRLAPPSTATVPPELLPRFVDAWNAGSADFINGSRIVYPMEGEAMRFLNRLGNVFFAKALTWILGVRLGDCLCGTKLLAKADYDRIVAWRRDFGDFDPFGDFELLFGAAVLALGVVDVPVRYRARTYGTTNISRFRHGWMLLRMTLIGFFRVKLGRVV